MNGRNLRLVIFGSRTIPFEKGLVTIGELLGSRLCEVTEVVSGTAAGADKIGEVWARAHGIPVNEFRPDKSHGFPAALFIRNTDMAEYCDEGLCLWDGESNGTQHMMKQLTKFNKPYVMKIIRLTPEPKGLEAFFE